MMLRNLITENFLKKLMKLKKNMMIYCCHKVDTYKSKGLAMRLCKHGHCPSVIIIKNGHIVKQITEETSAGKRCRGESLGMKGREKVKKSALLIALSYSSFQL